MKKGHPKAALMIDFGLSKSQPAVSFVPVGFYFKFAADFISSIHSSGIRLCAQIRPCFVANDP